jgi:NADH dehydrogenase
MIPMSTPSASNRQTPFVPEVDEHGIDTDATDPALQRIEAATKIWAAGVQASPLGRIIAEASGAKVNRAGRVMVRPD